MWKLRRPKTVPRKIRDEHYVRLRVVYEICSSKVLRALGDYGRNVKTISVKRGGEGQNKRLIKSHRVRRECFTNVYRRRTLYYIYIHTSSIPRENKNQKRSFSLVFVLSDYSYSTTFVVSENISKNIQQRRIFFVDHFDLSVWYRTKCRKHIQYVIYINDTTKR